MCVCVCYAYLITISMTRIRKSVIHPSIPKWGTLKRLILHFPPSFLLRLWPEHFFIGIFDCRITFWRAAFRCGDMNAFHKWSHQLWASVLILNKCQQFCVIETINSVMCCDKIANISQPNRLHPCIYLNKHYNGPTIRSKFYWNCVLTSSKPISTSLEGHSNESVHWKSNAMKDSKSTISYRHMQVFFSISLSHFKESRIYRNETSLKLNADNFSFHLISS